jgi:prepilin-type N-terminal cleavage/methylation domain-containing protein
MVINKKRFLSGFTLIELLVVVAIIALLASVVLAALDTAKAKGADANIKTNLDTLRSVAENFFLDNGGSYIPHGGLASGPEACPVFEIAGSSMFSRNSKIADAIKESIKWGKDKIGYCYASDLKWAVAVQLKVDPTTSWCISNNGFANIVPHTPDLAIDSSGSCIQ